MAQVIDFLSHVLVLLEAREVNKVAVKELWTQIHQALSTLRVMNAWIPTHEISLAIRRTNLAIESIPLSFWERQMQNVKGFAQENPKFVKGAGAAAVIGGGVVLAPIAAVGLLNLIGFSSIGPVAGSAAAAWQATYGGSVAAGSAFALAQSAAMGGIAVAGAGEAIVAGAAVAGGVAALRQKKKDEDEDDDRSVASDDVKDVAEVAGGEC